MFARFSCALLIFHARMFPAKSETQEPRKIIVERTLNTTISIILYDTEPTKTQSVKLQSNITMNSEMLELERSDGYKWPHIQA